MTLIKNLILIAILFLSMNVAAQNERSYLSNHAVDLSEGGLNKNELDSSFFNHKFFLLSEIHGIQKGQDIDYAMVTLLNRELNVNTYVAEFDFAKAYFLNQYLEHGNEKLLDDVFEYWVKNESQWGNKDFQNKIRKIRLYNQQLKPNQRIYFEGIDQIDDQVIVARYLKEVLKDPSVQKMGKAFQPLINALAAKKDSLIISISTSLMSQFDLNQEYKGVSKFDDLRFALKNCMKMNTHRETLLHDNFAELFKSKNWKDKKLYGFFGFGHVIQGKLNREAHSSLAVRVNEDESLALKGQILSMVMLYVDSKMMMPTSGTPEAWQDKGKRYSAITQFNHDGPLINLEGIADFKAVTKPGTTTLFNLKTEGSPYLRKTLNLIYADAMPKGMRLFMDEKGKYATDYFQYLVLVRNSEATQPVNNEL